jgi:hypothetical protein
MKCKGAGSRSAGDYLRGEPSRKAMQQHGAQLCRDRHPLMQLGLANSAYEQNLQTSLFLRNRTTSSLRELFPPRSLP